MSADTLIQEYVPKYLSLHPAQNQRTPIRFNCLPTSFPYS